MIQSKIQDVHNTQKSQLEKKDNKKSLVFLAGILLILVIEFIIYYTPIELNFIVKPIETSSISLSRLNYQYQKSSTLLKQNSENLIYLKTHLSPHIYRYEVDIKNIPELADLAFVQEGYQSSLELWSTPDLSQIQTNTALRTAMSKANISGEIFLPKLRAQSVIEKLPPALESQNKSIICYLRIVGDLKRRLSSSYGLDLSLTQELIGFSYDYQIGVDKLGKVQYVLPLSRIDAEMNKTLINALWQLPFEPSPERLQDEVEWGRVKIEFDY